MSSILSVSGVSMVGLCVTVPNNLVKTSDMDVFQNTEAATKFEKNTKIEQRYISSDNQTTLDLCYSSAKDLLNDLGWKDVDYLIFVSQTGDYLTPNNAIISQNLLGLSRETVAFDLTLGCSGLPYSWYLISNMMSNFPGSKGLLLIGDTLSKQASPFDKSTYPLFGDAGAAVAFENNGKSSFDCILNSDGSGYSKIIVPGGMYRQPFTENNVNYQINEDGVKRKINQTIMDGAGVYEFTLFDVYNQIVRLIENTNLIKTRDEVDYFFFHQANGFIIDSLSKKLDLDIPRVLNSIKYFGNTSSASILVSIASNLNQIEAGKTFLFSGFGVGLSWGSLIYKVGIRVDLIKIKYE